MTYGGNNDPVEWKANAHNAVEGAMNAEGMKLKLVSLCKWTYDTNINHHTSSPIMIQSTVVE
jgi:hypothetical protein